MGRASERDLGENATPVAPWRVCTGVFSLHLQQLIDDNIHSIKVALGLQVGPFTLRVVGVVGITYLLPQEEQPLCHPSVER